METKAMEFYSDVLARLLLGIEKYTIKKLFYFNCGISTLLWNEVQRLYGNNLFRIEKYAVN